MKTFNDRLKELRENYYSDLGDISHEMTKEELSNKFFSIGFNIDADRILKLERFDRSKYIKPDEVKAYCKIFNTSADYIFDLNNAPKHPVEKDNILKECGLSYKAYYMLREWNKDKQLKESDGFLTGNASMCLNDLLEYYYDEFLSARRKNRQPGFSIFSMIRDFLFGKYRKETILVHYTSQSGKPYTIEPGCNIDGKNAAVIYLSGKDTGIDPQRPNEITLIDDLGILRTFKLDVLTESEFREQIISELYKIKNNI